MSYPEAPEKARIVCKPHKPDDPIPEGAKVLHLVRHGEATHNVISAQRAGNKSVEESNLIYADEALHDAPLTQKGRRQAGAAGAAVLQGPFPEIAITSPLVRTCQTASGAMSVGGLKGVPIIAIEGCRERTGVHTCDGRKPVEETSKSHPRIDFGLIDKGPDTRHSKTVRETVPELASRARGFYWSLRSRPETVIAVFTHSSFLRNGIEHGLETPDPSVYKRFENGEHRLVTLTFHDS